MADNSMEDISINQQNDGIRWCRECGVPIFGSVCESCGSNGIYCAKDLKPVFGKERRMFEKFLSIELPEVLYRNKTRIVFEGETLFRFRTDFRKLELYPVEPVNQIKDRLSKFEQVGWKAHLNQVEKSNDGVLREKERAAIEFIKESSEHHSEKHKIVSFAGGKDSAVVSLLTKKALRKIPLFFADTTLEYPETYQFIEQFAERYHFKLVKDQDGGFYRSKQDFFKLCRKLGPPSIRYRWCCYVFKAYPISKFYENLSEMALAFSGIRRTESLSRKRLPAISENKKIVRQILAHPIIDWKEAEVWFYLLRKNVIYNPLYELGHIRVGCWPCPCAGPTMCFFRKLTHPNLLKKFEGILTNYAKKMGEPEGWVENGWWRLRRPGRNKKVIGSVEAVREGENYRFRYRLPLDLNALEHLRSFGPLAICKNNGSHEYSVVSENISISGAVSKGKSNLVLVCDSKQYLKERTIFEKQMTRAINCIGCGGCTGSCPNGAMDVLNGHLVINPLRCNNCGKCATRNCMVLKFANERTHIKANLFTMSPCVEGLPMNHLTFQDASIGREFALTLRKKGVTIEVHDGGKTICVDKKKTQGEVEKLVINYQQTKKPTNKKTNKQKTLLIRPIVNRT